MTKGSRFWLRCGLASVLSITPAGLAEAQSVSPPSAAATDVPPASLDETLQGQARADYQAGRLLYEVGDYASARLKFEAAYGQSGDPRLLWNAAACERSLRHYVKASQLVLRFLELRGAHVTPEETEEARAFLDAAEPLTAPFVIESTRPGGAAWLDDEPLGALPLAPDARIDIGKHRLLVKVPGFRDFRDELTVTSQARLTVRVTLRPLDVPRRLPPVRSPEPSRLLPAWAWVAGGSLLLAGAVTAGYFVLRPDTAEPLPGSIASYRF